MCVIRKEETQIYVQRGFIRSISGKDLGRGPVNK